MGIMYLSARSGNLFVLYAGDQREINPEGKEELAGRYMFWPEKERKVRGRSPRIQEYKLKAI